MKNNTLPKEASVVVIGGGVIGCSTAYHLAKYGWENVVLVEKNQITSGTTWHAAGLVTTLRDTESQTKLAQYSLKLYDELEKETGQATGFIQCGSIQLATSKDKAEEMRRGCAMARSFGVENSEVSPSEVKDLFPLAFTDDLESAFYFPEDGRVNPADVTQALAKGARNRGVLIKENTEFLGFKKAGDIIQGVQTSKGFIKTDHVVLCPGMWGYELGRKVGVNIPLQAAEHYYLISEPIDGVSNKLPILRDPGRCAYAREEAGKILLGFFEPNAAAWSTKKIPEDFCFGEIQPDWDRMEKHIEVGMQRLPILFETGIRQFFCGPESFTPDHNYLMGRAPNIRNLFVGCGFNSLGILSGGGAGHVLSRWLTDQIQPMDIWDVDIRRVPECYNNKSFIVDRTSESLGIAYQMHWPNRQWETGRNLKKSVLHNRLEKIGGVFGQSAGWERVNWFADSDQKAKYEYDFFKQNWFENNRKEHEAVREHVGIFDQSSFSKFLVQGHDSVRVLNKLATTDLDKPVGKVMYTQFLNNVGGVEADLTITRLSETEFLVVTAAFTATHVFSWIKEKIEHGQFCVITDVSGAYSMLNIQGPKSRQLISSLTDPSIMSNDLFPFGTSKTLEIGYQTALAVRISYTGELGYELYIPTEMTEYVYDQIVEEGAKFNLKHCGYHALNSLRIEKAYREWSHDMGPRDTITECGLQFTCDWSKPGGFIGKDYLEKNKQDLASRKLIQFKLKDSNALLFHNEPIIRNGKQVGYIASAGYGFTVGSSIGLGYVNNKEGVDDDFILNGEYYIEQADRRYDAVPSIKPFYDPKSVRTRS
ncbi:MAG: FAD-dependent oxidoreductase [Pseudomonadota bacterium]|nr:FAD-dependent oxidoreductase [Pseudomonadota bacterium]